MRKLEKGEFVRINNEQERDEFLQYLEDNTELKWTRGRELPSKYKPKLMPYPYFFCNINNELLVTEIRDYKQEIPLSEFLNPKITIDKNVLIQSIGQAKFDEIMEPKLKENTWYKLGKFTFIKRTTGTRGFGYNPYSEWIEDSEWSFGRYPSTWTEMTPSEIEAVLKRRCEEIGTLNGEFECLSNANDDTECEPMYFPFLDQLWTENGLIYQDGEFAKLIEKKPTTIELTKNEIKAIECFSEMAEIDCLFNAETKQAIESLMIKVSAK